jgi:hypothetical protein
LQKGLKGAAAAAAQQQHGKHAQHKLRLQRVAVGCTHIIQAMKKSADATSMAVGEAVTEHRSHCWYTGRCEPVGLLEPNHYSQKACG